MADHRDTPGRGPRGFGERGYEERGGQQRRHDSHDPSYSGFGRGSARERMGSEQFEPPEGCGGDAEREYRDYGRNQPGGVYEHSGRRPYRHGDGYGGFGEAPGESGGGFGSGRTYAAEPGWGPGYGDRESSFDPYGPYAGAGHHDGPGGRSESPSGNRGYEGRGGHPGSYGAQRGGYGGHERADRDVAPSLGTRRHGRGPKGYQRSDERVKEDICERLMAEPYVDSSEVAVEVKEGMVTLEGTVPERRMKHRIEDIADACIGVKDIDNRIRVAHPGSVSSGAQSRQNIGGGRDVGGSGESQDPGTFGE